MTKDKIVFVYFPISTCHPMTRLLMHTHVYRKLSSYIDVDITAVIIMIILIKKKTKTLSTVPSALCRRGKLIRRSMTSLIKCSVYARH